MIIQCHLPPRQLAVIKEAASPDTETFVAFTSFWKCRGSFLVIHDSYLSLWSWLLIKVLRIKPILYLSNLSGHRALTSPVYWAYIYRVFIGMLEEPFGRSDLLKVRLALQRQSSRKAKLKK